MTVLDRVTGSGQKRTGPPRAAGLVASARQLTAMLAGILGNQHSHNDNDQEQAAPERAVELDCLRHVLASGLLASAERRSHALGVGADQVLIQWGAISEDAYLDYLAASTSLTIEDLAQTDRDDFPLPAASLQFVARHGYLPIRCDGELIYIVAPRGTTARRIVHLLERFPELRERIRLTTHATLNTFLSYHCGPVLADAAAGDLAERYPGLSAAPAAATMRWRSAIRYLRRISVPVALLTFAPLALLDTVSIVLAIWFLLFTGLRLVGSLAPFPDKKPLPRLPDSELPVYTVVAALYREAASVAPLMRFIEALDYPREKLDIKLVIEPDDLRTRAAIARLGPMPHVQVIVAPDAGPRTKPKALNCALSFARGTFITVFDAEDRPEPGQLRAALDVFREGDDEVACAQASLCIDNTADGWLTRMFTAEYAGQFDVFLQGFSRFRMPLPLGGSSNHFRTSVLRDVGGWDPYNVTEDADLGFRLARFGYRSVMFPSTTYEEAPARFGAWLRQRSRWMKGFMQTWSVHMRAPLQLWRGAGAGGFFTLNILVGGNVLTALAHPFLLAEILLRSVLGLFSSSVTPFLDKPYISLYLTAIGAGYFTTIAIGLIGLHRRGLLREAWALILTPIYWMCLSMAAWRALYQLLREPYHWEKTEHGLAQSSRVAAPLQAQQPIVHRQRTTQR